ncbi:leucine-rich repeat-containing protein 40 [Caerostris extrusa]|uniref:Leucine-rich repeat-containing protein 40 n=1 Tax=Caerostris extrusa TaxID=172846 RepID=A0AAV4TS32_CAEEX|nr:leucine-rich repeat-containing protein 40 [Caerostris extrusa]
MKSTKSLPLSNKNITIIPKDVLEAASTSDVTVVDFSRNNITQIPDEFEIILPKLTEINLGYNKINSVPSFIGLGQHLQFLDIRNNRLETLPAEVASLVSLREINISYNRFRSLPTAFIPVLAVLDLHNNSIKVVPPELGNFRQLRSLLLDGNLFRNPRPAILSKGTPALLEFLRSRIPQN